MAKRVKHKGGKMTAVYLRVSTDKQKHDSQIVDIKRYLKGHGIANVRWYKDKISGVSPKFPDMDRMEKAIFMGEIEQVIVWRLDRISRKGIRDGLNTLGRWLEKGVHFVSVDEALFDFSGPTGELIAAFCFYIAKIEHENIARRIRAGLRARKAKGLPMGRQKGQCPKWNPAKRKVDPALACSLREQGVSVADIAERFDCSKVAVYNVLRPCRACED